MNPQVASNKVAAIWLVINLAVCLITQMTEQHHSAVIPIAAYAFVGIEIVSAAPIEVKQPQKNLPTPSNYIAPVAGLIYLLLLLMMSFDVYWQDPSLPPFYGITLIDRQNTLQRGDPGYSVESRSNFSPVLVLVVQHAEIEGLAGFLTATLIFLAYNTAIVALYVASRTLHGITRDINFNSSFLIKRWIAYLSITTNSHRVPSVALFVSAVVFGSWLPLLHFVRAHPSISDVSSIYPILYPSILLVLQVTADPQYHWNLRVRVCLGESMPSLHQLPEMVSYFLAFHYLRHQSDMG